MSGINTVSRFLLSVATQVRAAIEVGVSSDDIVAGARQSDACEPTFGMSDAQRWDDAPGRITRNGLGSLEIGAGKARVDE